ncbi:hypothetical protein O5D80_007346 [Batrachochytrium dendrobatidis]|nr:hypothetical protein O5D80_007346 [Batrachochytrium dendrobatidis]
MNAIAKCYKRTPALLMGFNVHGSTPLIHSSFSLYVFKIVGIAVCFCRVYSVVRHPTKPIPFNQQLPSDSNQLIQHTAGNSLNTAVDSCAAFSLDGSVQKAWTERFAPTIAHLSVSLDAQRYQAAIIIFNHIKNNNMQLLSTLQPHYFSTLLHAIYHNKNRALGVVPKAKAALFAASAIDVMRSVGIQRDYEALALSIDIYGYLRNLEQVEDALENIQILGYNLDNHRITASACRAYIFCGHESIGLEYFDILSENSHTIRTYNFLLGVYIEMGNEAGVLKSLAKIQLEHLTVDAFTMQMLCHHYAKKKQYELVKKHIEAFRSNGGLFHAGLYRVLMGVANHTGDYQQTIALLQEMRHAGIEPTDHIYAQVVIAYAGMRDSDAMWDAYLLAARSRRVDNITVMAMATMLGTLANTNIVSDLRTVSVHTAMPFRQVLLDLIRGYRLLGKPDCVKELLQWQKVSDKRFTLKQYESVIWAYHRNGNARGAISYAKFLDSVYGNTIPVDVWIAVVVCCIQYLPDAVDKIILHIEQIYTDISVEDARNRAYKLIDKIDYEFKESVE